MCETLVKIMSDSKPTALCFKPQHVLREICFIRFEKHRVSDFKLFNNIAHIVCLNCVYVMSKQKANKR